MISDEVQNSVSAYSLFYSPKKVPRYLPNIRLLLALELKPLVDFCAVIPTQIVIGDDFFVVVSDK